MNTALAGWAQFRHTWALQSKDDAMWFSGSLPFPGFVEPNPAFFHRLSEAIILTIREFDSAGSLEVSRGELMQEAAELLPRLEALSKVRKAALEPFSKKLNAGAELTAEEQAIVEKASAVPEDLAEDLVPFFQLLGGSVALRFPGPVITGVGDLEDTAKRLQEVASGHTVDELMRQQQSFRDRNLRERWLDLLRTCQQLETLAHRQLRGLEPTKDEARFITGYGARLGGIMLYEGNSYHHPRDDAPRVATVFTRPGEKCLLAGTGRPREIRVLYPWKGQEINCRGAILTFHEMQAEQRMTDAEWMKLLDSNSGPADPAWLSPIVAPEGKARKPGE